MFHLLHHRREDAPRPGWRQDGWGEFPTTDAPTTFTDRDGLDPWWPEVTGVWVDGQGAREVREQR